ncbi:unnamed protein product [Prunus armeniaca]
MCLIFPSTLSGAALNWFYRLNPRTINSFDSLKQVLSWLLSMKTSQIGKSGSTPPSHKSFALISLPSSASTLRSSPDPFGRSVVDKLSNIGFIKEVDYPPSWLTNVVMYKMRLNPMKWAFGVASGKFLGFMINQRGIEANLEKIQAILDMKIPTTVMDIQSLTGCIASLTRFISKAIDRCALFFKALKDNKQSIT